MQKLKLPGHGVLKRCFTFVQHDIEAMMLELDDNVNEYSRLGCQIQISDGLDGMVLRVANE